MEPIGGTEVGSAIEAFQLGDEIQRLVVAPPETANSFTSLLEMSASQAAELLHSPETAVSPANFNVKSLYSHALHCAPAFPSDGALIERAAKYSVFATAGICGRGGEVKSEPAESGSNPNSSDPTEASENEKPLKRKEREKKGKGSSKKNKVTANRNIEDGEKLPYVHVRARRGQATDSHSLAERARREKINARMKFLQELVPGCNKISGTALVLDEIINHVQSLQRQVEYLSMRLAAVNPRIGFNIDSSLTGGSGTIMDCSYPSMAMPLVWPELQMNGERQHCQPQWHIESLNQPLWTKDDNQHSLVTPEHSLLSYDSSGNSASLHSSQLKMEL